MDLPVYEGRHLTSMMSIYGPTESLQKIHVCGSDAGQRGGGNTKITVLWRRHVLRVLLTTHPLLVPRSWKSRAKPLPILWAIPGL